LVTGKVVSGFTNEEEEEEVDLAEIVPFLLEEKLAERGATVEKAPNFQAKVLVSDRLVTGQNSASAAGVAERMVKLLAAENSTISILVSA
jgi:putative intracellular protease/amidase